MEFKDYYAILGVSPEADEKTIKSAYRKLARQHHPDVNPGNKEAEEKFKEINEAYQAISNQESRRKYDELRQQYQRWQKTGGPRQGQEFDWQGWQAAPGQGVHVEYGAPGDFEDLFGSESPYSEFFTSIFGQPRRGASPPRPRQGRDMEYEVDVSLEEAYRGSTRLLQIGERRIEATIPPGVRTGSRIRLAGQGEPGRNGAPAGDLYLVIRLLHDPRYEREGDDLYTEVPVDVYTAVAGGEVRVLTFDRPVMLRIPPQTQAGRNLRLRGKGMPHLGKPSQHGDLYARVVLVLPESMSEQEIETFRKLAAERQGSLG